MLLAVDESNCLKSSSIAVDSVCCPTQLPAPTIGDPAAPPVLSEFWRLVVEKFILPASPVSRGCLILLSRTCCKRSES